MSLSQEVCKFSLVLQSTKRPDHGNTCPSTGKTVGNANPEPTPAVQPWAAAATPDEGWTLTSWLPRAGSHTPDSPPRARTTKSVKPAGTHPPRTPLAPSQPGPSLPNCPRSAPASRLHSATSSLLAGLAAPPPQPRRPALGPPHPGRRPPAPAEAPGQAHGAVGPFAARSPPPPRPELPPRAPHPQPPPSPRSAAPGPLPLAGLPGGKGGRALHPGPQVAEGPVLGVPLLLPLHVVGVDGEIGRAHV